MRIRLVAPPWFAVPPERYGGTEQIVASLADGLAARGHEVELFASGGSSSRARLCSPYAEPPSDSLGDALVELPHVLAAHADRRAVDVVHDHTTLGAALGAVGSGAPVVHTLHGQWTPKVARIHEQVGERVHLVAISRDQAARAPAGVRLAGVVHNGIDVGRFPFRSTADADGHLAFLGRAGADKGADVAVEVAARTGRPLRMAVKIAQPEERQWWREVMAPLLASTAIPVEVVRNADHREKLAVIGGAHALLCPLRWDEPFGLMMVEAPACGTPVVAWERGAAGEVVDHGRSGFLVTPDDVDGLCGAVASVDELDRRAARTWVEQRFSDERMVSAYLRLYRRVVAGRVTTRRVVHDGQRPDLVAGTDDSPSSDDRRGRQRATAGR